MSIKIIDDNLFHSHARFIVHQVNCKGVMGSGVAQQIRMKYPHVFIEYKKICSIDMLGKIQVIPCDPKLLHTTMNNQCGDIIHHPIGTQFIVNAFAQSDFGYDGKQYTNIKALEQCFKSIYGLTRQRNNNSNATVAMPWKIGCYRGGANWDDVYQMIQDIFKHTQVELWRLDNG